MILGILSDSHDQHRRVATALRLLEEHGAQQFIHCGDIGEHVFEEFVGRPVRFVWGNCDYTDPRMLAYLKSLDLSPPEAIPLRLELAGRNLCVFHGHETLFARALRWIETGEWDRLHALIGPVDYLLYGHSHIAADRRVGPVRIINPGALHRAAEYTVATLDLQSERLTLLPVE